MLLGEGSLWMHYCNVALKNMFDFSFPLVKSSKKCTWPSQVNGESFLGIIYKSELGFWKSWGPPCVVMVETFRIQKGFT